MSLDVFSVFSLEFGKRQSLLNSLGVNDETLGPCPPRHWGQGPGPRGRRLVPVVQRRLHRDLRPGRDHDADQDLHQPRPCQRGGAVLHNPCGDLAGRGALHQRPLP